MKKQWNEKKDNNDTQYILITLRSLQEKSIARTDRESNIVFADVSATILRVSIPMSVEISWKNSFEI